VRSDVRREAGPLGPARDAVGNAEPRAKARIVSTAVGHLRLQDDLVLPRRKDPVAAKFAAAKAV
jgi:hypothetical protein